MGNNDNLDNLLRTGGLKAEPPDRQTARNAKACCVRLSTACRTPTTLRCHSPAASTWPTTPLTHWL